MTDQTPEPLLPPQDLDAEEGVLGAMLVAPAQIEWVRETGLRGDDFYRGSHRRVYETVCRMADAGEAVDSITVTAELGRSGQLEEVGGKPTIHTLAATVPAVANAVHYARLVQEAAYLRGLIRVGTEMTHAGQNGGGGVAGHVERWVEQLRERPTGERPAAGFALLTPDELVEMPEPDWLIEPYVPTRGLVILFGPPSTYKSFVAIMLMGEAGGGVYLCAEGAPHKIGKRIKAWEAAAGRPSGILVHPYGPNLLDPDAVSRAIAAVRQTGRTLPLVVIDTIARHTPGADENAGKDMGRFIGHCDRLRSELGCAVVGVGHTGHKETGRLRGWSGQYAATDVEISVERDGDLRARLKCSKPPRDGEAFDPRLVTLEPTAGSLAVAQVVTSEDVIEAAVREYLADHPDASQRDVEKSITGRAATIREAYRKCVPTRDAGGGE